jgi:hypothetical protein
MERMRDLVAARAAAAPDDVASIDDEIDRCCQEMADDVARPRR